MGDGIAMMVRRALVILRGLQMMRQRLDVRGVRHERARVASRADSETALASAARPRRIQRRASWNVDVGGTANACDGRMMSIVRGAGRGSESVCMERAP